MRNTNNQDAEREYRVQLLREKGGDPQLYDQYVSHLANLAREGFRTLGPGVLLVVDNGSGGFEGYVPAEAADLQFGKEVSHLCSSYDSSSEWILVAFTNGQSFPIVMPCGNSSI